MIQAKSVTFYPAVTVKKAKSHTFIERYQRCDLVTRFSKYTCAHTCAHAHVCMYVRMWVTWSHYYIYVLNIYIYNKGLSCIFAVTFGVTRAVTFFRKVTGRFLGEVAVGGVGQTS